MEEKLYQFAGAYKRTAIKIQSYEKYNTLSLLSSDDTPLKKNPTFYIKEGKKLFDIVQFNDSMNFAISTKFKMLLEKNKFTGWSSFPIKIDAVTEQYYAFMNVSKAGPILNLEALNNYETEFTEFDVSSWDGSDIFHLKDTLLNVCTEKVKMIIEDADISNIEIKPL